MNRQELLNYIKDNNLKEEVKQQFGKPYNSVSTIFLEEFINIHEESKKPKNVVNNIPTDRKELWNYIKKNNLQDYIKEHTGKNYTIVSTEVLHTLCVKHFNVLNNNTEKYKSIKIENKNPHISTTTEIRLNKIEDTLRSMAKILNLKTVLKNLE